VKSNRLAGDVTATSLLCDICDNVLYLYVEYPVGFSKNLRAPPTGVTGKSRLDVADDDGRAAAC